MTSILEVEQLDTLSSNASSTLTIGGTNTTTIAFGPNVTTTPSSLANTPAFSVSKSSNQSVPNATSTKITWESENWDTDNAFASSTFTVPTGKGGKYNLSACVRIEYGNGSGEYGAIDVYKNGSQYRSALKAVSGNAVQAQSLPISIDMDLSAGDTVEIYVYHNKGTSQDAFAGANTFWMMHKIIGA
jgi:hypothetical protein